MPNKYGAIKTEYNGRVYDSKFEASVAMELDLRVKAGEIASWEPQFLVEMWLHDEDGRRALKVTHKVDFRLIHNDGFYELLEAKGVETTDYRWRRKLLYALWLPKHTDHSYTVVRNNGRKRSK